MQLDGIISDILPVGDELLTAIIALASSVLTYLVGRARQKAEVENLKAEKKSIEAASGVSTAEAANVISKAAAATIQPLMQRVAEQSEEIKFLTDRNVVYRNELELYRTQMAKMAAENLLMKEKFRLQGEDIPELPKI